LPTLDWILAMLEDDKWHRVRELREKTELSQSKILRIIRFLAENHLIQQDERRQQIRLSPETRRFLKGLHEIE
jgi:DNA-binding IclR family transcriptional regulator